MYRFPLAIVSGLALWLAFPSHDLWALAPVGVALLALATRGASAWQGALLGLLSGLSCFLPLLSWSGIYVGALPWIALALLESGYIALVGLTCALLQRGSSPEGFVRVRPIVVALAWVGEELLRDNTPFGGFPWGRLAFSQADSPLAGLAALGGAPAVTFGVALAGGFLAAGAARLISGRRATGRSGVPRNVVVRSLVLAAPSLLCAVAVMALPVLVPRPVDGPTGRFMAVQGNVPRPGLEFNAERRAVLDNHARETLKAAGEVPAGEQSRPDLVVWPENASDIDPLRNPDAAAVINETVDAIHAPLVLGAVLQGPRPFVSNASLLYLPGQGVTSQYIKQHPVPFAEYIPYRSFFRHFSDKVDLVSSDFKAGTGAGVFRVPAHQGGTIAAGPIICFEVAYDGLVRDTVDHGANVLLVQTNNATFGFSDESVQQLAISRIRAIEHGRSIVHVSTVGVSAMITPDGTAHQRTTLFTSAVLAADLPLRTDRTIADRVGSWPEYLAGGVLVLMLVLLGLRRRRR
ncbi:MAG TPA: apolipoprotein N-acyltransferase [Dermatophilaceae bacterium]|nr:apolipoprotein N-acyltransferase [Dermatophilaceae bacterium]